MQALNVDGSQLGEVTSMAYSLAELVSFFTAGDDECRAWTIRNGTNAQDAAGAIHSDLARGFIRAEVIRWDQLLEAGSEAAAKKRGWVRQEGKVYLVQDGDVLHVLFNVYEGRRASQRTGRRPGSGGERLNRAADDCT